MGRAAAAIGLAILTALQGVGCTLSTEKRGALESMVPDARISSAQFRLWVYDAVLHFADRIEEAADRIEADTRDPQVRRNAILWKINAVQASFRAATRRDPLGAFADLWILTRQMAAFFDTGCGRDVFGAQQSVGVVTSREIEARMGSTFMAAMKPESADRGAREVREYVDSFAKDHPLQNLHFVREPLTGHAGSHVFAAVEGLGAVASNVEQDLLTVQRIAAVYLEFLPTLARWQAELMLEDLGKSGVVADSLALIRDMAVATKEIPEIVTGQTTRILSAVTQERKAALGGIEEMRVATVKTMESERKAITAEIDRQRLETLEQIRGERKTVLEDIRVVARDTTASAVLPGKQLIDYLVRKVLLIGASVAGIFVLGLGLVMTHLRPRGKG